MKVQLNIIDELTADVINNPDQIWIEQRQKQAIKVVEAVEVLDDAVNSMDAHLVGRIFLERMTRMHRTLQQSLMGVMLDVIYDYSKLEDRMVDGRNECSREIAKHMIQGIEDAGKYTIKGIIERPRLSLI